MSNLIIQEKTIKEQQLKFQQAYELASNLQEFKPVNVSSTI